MRARPTLIAILTATICVASIVATSPTASARALRVPCSNGWASAPFATGFRVWAACDRNDPASVLQAGADIGVASQIVQKTWTTMVGIMPAPLPDLPRADDIPGNPDNLVDVYLVGPSRCIQNRGSHAPVCIPKIASAGTNSDDAEHPDLQHTSGFILLDRPKVSPTSRDFVSDLVHEFFHLQQLHVNALATYRNGEQNWIEEATAVWAQWRYAKTDPPGPDQVHYRFRDSFLPASDQSLHSTNVAGLPKDLALIPYSRYIWFYFMSLVVGQDAPAELYASLSDVAPGDFKAILNAVDKKVPGGFKQSFREFAIRNINNETLTKDVFGSPTYASQATPDTFPGGAPPFKVDGQLDVTPRPQTAQVQGRQGEGVPALAAHYYHLKPANDVRSLVLDMRNLAPRADLDVDVLLHSTDAGKWIRRTSPGQVALDNQAMFCFDWTQNKDIDDAYLVLSNHSLDTLPGNEGVTGSFTYQGLKDCPNRIVEDGGPLVHQTDGAVGTASVGADIHQTVTMHLKMKFDNGQWVDDGGSWDIDGTKSSWGQAGICFTRTNGKLSGHGTFTGYDPSAEGTGRVSTVEFERDANRHLTTLRLNIQLVGHTRDVTTRCGVQTGTDDNHWSISLIGCNATHDLRGDQNVEVRSNEELFADMTCQGDIKPQEDPYFFTARGTRSLTGHLRPFWQAAT